MSPRLRCARPLWLLSLVVLSAAGCAGRLDVPLDARTSTVRLVHGETGPEIAQLLETVYQTAFDPVAARAQAANVLKLYPHSGAAHEVAGYLAQLADEPHESWFHFWSAAQDLDAPLTELYLWELDNDLTRSELDASLALYATLRSTHPSPLVRSSAAFAEAVALRRLGRLEDARARIAPLGFIRDWAILGAFDNEAGKGFLTEYPPETKQAPIDISQSVAGPLLPLKWQTLTRTSDLGAVEIGYAVEPQDPGVAYLATWAHVDTDTQTELRISTSHPTRAWLNTTLVLSEEQVSGADLDNLILPVTLHKGWNQLLIKSAQKDGWWALQARFTDRTGAPLGGLTTSAQPQAFARGSSKTASIAATSVVLLPPTLASLEPSNRRAYLAGRWLARGGHLQPEQNEVQRFLDKTPDNLLAAYGLSLAYWANGEAGKGIDLLNRGVKQGGMATSAFLRLRGLYYQQRGLYDKAQADFLTEIKSNPHARTTESDFADLLEQRGWKVDGCRQWEATAKTWPDSVTVLRNLGNCQLALGYQSRGLDTLAQALRLEPGAGATLRRLYSQAASESHFAEASRYLDSLRALAPNAPAYCADEADLLRRQGRPAEAEARFRAAMALNPLWAGPYEALGDLYLEQGRSADAVAQWKQALERDPNNATLSQRSEHYQPTKLGFMEAYLPAPDAIDRALSRKMGPSPGSQTALLLDDEVTEVNADGSAKRFVTEVRQALNEQGRDALISERLPGNGTLKLLNAYSLSPKGERQEASSIRGSEVRFRNLEVGSRVVIQYVHYAPAEHFLENQYIANWYFRTPGRQHEESRWVLILPKSRALKVNVNGDIKHEETTVGDRRVNIWSVSHAPPLVPEPHGPPLVDLVWRVAVSTVPDWDDYVRWERALLAEAFRSSPKLDALAANLIEGSKTPHDKLDRLYEFVTKEIRYQQDYESTIAGVRPHACPVVLERGYGDCKDKAVLLMHLAKLAGIKLKFAILRTTSAGRVIADVPNQQFNHAIVYVPVQPGFDQPFFLDPTSDGLDLGNLPYVDQGAQSLVLDPEDGSWSMIPIPYQPADINYSRSEFAVQIESPTKATASGDITARGVAGVAFRHVLRNSAVADQVMQSLAASLFPGGRLTQSTPPPSESTAKPVSLRMDVDVSHSLQTKDKGFRFVLAPGSQELEGMVTLERRTTPLNLGVPVMSSRTIAVTAPEGFVVDHVPPSFALSHPCLTLSRQSRVQGRTVMVIVESRFSCNEVPAESYAPFRDAVRQAISQLRDDVGFAPVAAPARRRSEAKIEREAK